MAKTKDVPPPMLNRHLTKLLPYPPGKPVEEVQRMYGLNQVDKLASNENPNGPSPRAIKAMRSAATDMHFYPDGAGYYLKEKIAEKIGVKPEELILGNGSDDIFIFLAQCYLSKSKGMLTSNYAFVRYRMAAELVGAPCKLVPMQDMHHDLKALGKAVTQSTVMICLDVPGNPTGTSLKRKDLVGFLESIPPEIIVVLDQAYYEYAAEERDFPDGLKLRKDFPNLVVTRTFSKAYGLAGLRIGYAVARPEIITDLERVRPPFNANRMAQAAAMAALDDRAHLIRSLRNNQRGMQQLEKGFKKLGINYWPSKANFILCDVGRPAKPVFDELLKHGTIVRPMGAPGMEQCLRISIGTPQQNRRCLAAIEEVLAGEPAAS